MLNVDAAEQRALVAAAGALLLAPLLATHVVRAAGQLAAGYLLVHVAAAAPNYGALRTRGARTYTK